MRGALLSERSRQDHLASLRRCACCASPQDSRVVILEYEVHGRILSSGPRYENRLISVVTIENRKIAHLERLHGFFS
jgi:hypothetical protein